jgi:hypothetical protein
VKGLVTLGVKLLTLSQLSNCMQSTQILSHKAVLDFRMLRQVKTRCEFAESLNLLQTTCRVRSALFPDRPIRFAP